MVLKGFCTVKKVQFKHCNKKLAIFLQSPDKAEEEEEEDGGAKRKLLLSEEEGENARLRQKPPPAGLRRIESLRQ